MGGSVVLKTYNTLKVGTSLVTSRNTKLFVRYVPANLPNITNLLMKSTYSYFNFSFGDVQVMIIVDVHPLQREPLTVTSFH